MHYSVKVRSLEGTFFAHTGVGEVKMYWHNCMGLKEFINYIHCVKYSKISSHKGN